MHRDYLSKLVQALGLLESIGSKNYASFDVENFFSFLVTMLILVLLRWLAFIASPEIEIS